MSEPENVSIVVEVLRAKNLFSVQAKPADPKKAPSKSGKPRREFVFGPAKTQLSVVFPSHDRRDAEQPVDASEAPEYGSSFEFSQPKSAALIDSLCAQNLCVDVVDIGPAGERVTLGTAKIPLVAFAKQETQLSGWFPLSLPSDILADLSDDTAAPAGQLPGGRPYPEVEVNIKLTRAGTQQPLFTTEEAASYTQVNVRVTGAYSLPVTFAPVGSNPSTFTCSYQLNSTGEASQRVVESLPLDQVAPLSDNIITVTENAAPVPSVVFAHQRFALLDAHGAQSLKERLEQNQLFVTLTRHDDAPANADGSPAPPTQHAVSARAQLALPKLLKPGSLSAAVALPLKLVVPALAEGETAPEDVFAAVNSFVRFEISVSLPLVPKKIRSTIKVVDVLGPRPAPPVHSHGADAIHEFRVSVRKILAQLYAEYQGTPATSGLGKPMPAEQRRQNFFYHLNSSGLYQTFRDRLRAPIQRVVKEKFHKIAEQVESDRSAARARLFPNQTVSEGANAGGQMTGVEDRMLSDLYRTLSEEVQRCIADAVRGAHDKVMTEHTQKLQQPKSTLGSKPTTETPLIEDEVSRVAAAAAVAKQQQKVLADSLAAELRLAEECERSGDIHGAQIHFQNRVCSAARDPATWVQYALFCLRQTASEYRAQAEACLKEALRLQPDHVVALNVYAALLLEQNNLDQADVFVRGALSSDTTGASSETAASSVEVGKHAGVLTHVLSALWEYANEEDELSDAAFALAARAFPAALSTINTQPLIGDESVFVYAARVLLSLRCTQSAQRLLEKDVRDGKVSTLSRVIEQFKLGWQKSEDCESVLIPFVQDTDTAPKHPALLSTLGHFYFEHERYAEAQSCYERHVEHFAAVCDVDTWSRLARIYLHQQDFEAAKETYLKACRAIGQQQHGAAPASFWLGAGIAALRLHQEEEAERALAEANIQDPTNAVVWGYLTVLCLLRERDGEAEQALSQAIKLGLTNAQIFFEIGSLYFKLGKRSHAEAALRRAARLDEKSPHVRLLLAQVLDSQNLHEEAAVEAKLGEELQKVADEAAQAAAAAQGEYA